MTNQEKYAYQFMATKLGQLAGPESWPLAMIYYNPTKRTFSVMLAPAAGTLVEGLEEKLLYAIKKACVKKGE